ncbi:MAG: nucleoside-diphosphate kinase [Planctomycetota bacterium]|jgi:nucleoside-diphosphate kinase
MNSNYERTFVAIKHDGIQRSLVGEIIKRFERAGLKMTAMKMMIPSEERIFEHYGKDDVWFEKKGKLFIENLEKEGKTPEKDAIEYGKDIIRALAKFFVSGPMIAMVVEGIHARAVVKKLVGGTEPMTSDVGTIRGDFTLDSYAMANSDNRGVRNLIHCSDEPEEAEREVILWFGEDEIIKYRHIAEAMLTDINLDGYLE